MLGANLGFRPYPNPAPWNQYLLYFAICFFIMFFPFLVVDLYYAYRDNTCAPIYPPNTGINITLKNWLQADGYIILGFIVIFLILGIIACTSPLSLWVYGVWEAAHIIFILWRLSWLIVGAVMFWHGYAPNNSCAVNLARYMWSNLIIGFVWVVLEPLLAFLYPKAVPVNAAVPLPLSTPVSSASALVTPATPFHRPGGIVY